MPENVYTVSCKNKGVPYIRDAFLFAVFQFLTYIFLQRAPFPGAFCCFGRKNLDKIDRKNNKMYNEDTYFTRRFLL